MSASHTAFAPPRSPAARRLRSYAMEARMESLRMLREPMFVLPTLLFPALFMAVTLFCFNFIGDGLRDALDPRDR